MIELETRCRVCRRRFIPTRAAVVAGQWRTCPPCRDGPGAACNDSDVTVNQKASDIGVDADNERKTAP